MTTVLNPAPRLGDLLRRWRSLRRMSQLDLATQAEVSPRHLSFVETGRSRPSRELVLHLAEHLDVPLRDRNELLAAAGFAPLYRQSTLDDPALTSVRAAIDVLAELKPGRKLYTNVEFYAGIVMDSCGVPRELFTPTFASSRAIGWCAHVLEQAADNRLIRPSAHYRGDPPPQPIPAMR